MVTHWHMVVGAKENGVFRHRKLKREWKSWSFLFMHIFRQWSSHFTLSLDSKADELVMLKGGWEKKLIVMGCLLGSMLSTFMPITF